MAYRNWIFLFISMICSEFVFGQSNSYSPIALQDSNHFFIRVNGEGFSNSNAITNAFLFGFVNGRFVSDDEKQLMLDRSRSTILTGMDASYGVRFGWKSKKSDGIQFEAGVAEKYHIDATLTQDAMELALYGNRPFAGEEANLDDMRLRYSRWQDIHIGFANMSKSRWNYGVNIHGIIGNQNLDISTDYARLYTAENGAQLQLNGSIRGDQSDTARTAPYQMNGWGMGVSGFVQLNLKVNEKVEEGWLRLELNDFGFVRWTDKSARYAVDTIYYYEGTYIEDIFTAESDLNPLTPDSIFNQLTQSSFNGKYATYLPASVQLSLFQSFEKYDVWAGANYRINASYSTYFFTRVRYKWEHFRLGGLVGVGGYGTFNLGLDAAYVADKWQVELGTRNLEGLALWQHFGGTSGYVGITRFF